jgi:hypothetical protein
VKYYSESTLLCCRPISAPVLIYKDVNKEHEIGDGLPPASDVEAKRKSYRSTDLFIIWSTEHFLKHRAAGKFVILLDGHGAYCSSPLLLHTAVENNVAIIHVTGDHNNTLQHLCKCFFGPFKSYFKNQTAIRKTTCYRSGRPMGLLGVKLLP